MTSSEKRKAPRKALNVEFKAWDAADKAAGELIFDSIDISAGGMFLASELLLEPGQELWIRLHLPDCPPWDVKARVAWVTRERNFTGAPGMGLEFVELTDAARDAIEAFVRNKPHAPE